ncbi:MAG: VCBS repeat-containing protein [Bacteroidetes bacterium]|nr:VCBS repeat-containing protein [Bacteroidota bacterium]
MRSPSRLILIPILILALGCGSDDESSPPTIPDDDGTPVEESYFEIVSATHLPVTSLEGRSMDARFSDFDGDGDQDLVIVLEFEPNILLINAGGGVFNDESNTRLPRSAWDSQDVGVADFDLDGDMDIIVVTGDELVNELYLNNGNGTFSDNSDRLPVQGISYAVLIEDLDLDGDPDILIGNKGQNVILINDGAARFTDETADRLPIVFDQTRDLELGDVDGDGDLDLVVGNEDRNRLLINTGGGFFVDESDARIPIPEGVEETREADFGDVDGDGDLDLLFANINLIANGSPQNRLLLNDGNGFYSDVTLENLPLNPEASQDGDFLDLDQDGDLDIITGNVMLTPSGLFDPAPYLIWINDGSGVFTEATLDFFPKEISGIGFDIEATDLNGDGKPDLYLASRRTVDVLLLSR